MKYRYKTIMADGKSAETLIGRLLDVAKADGYTPVGERRFSLNLDGTKTIYQDVTRQKRESYPLNIKDRMRCSQF